ncbi:MAG: CBS domain-containing protein [Anaerolineales bacterium]|jgi:CBS domain-containing protein|nr:CBS domain-containing protein [Anaerolineales bacterium]MBX3004414.1 CBS domain-containing protein [Anaerolineales bacterium]MCW5838347.1 CBS domain-containing protein [Anaerolineales bacterium]
MNLPKVAEWMTTELITVAPGTPLPEAVALMRTNHIRRLPVVDDGRLVGIVTYGDLREASPSDATGLSVHEISYLLNKLGVDKLMTPKPYTVAPDTALTEAARLMLQHKIGALPVVDHGELVGLITESDIFRAFMRLFEEDKVAVAAV